MRELTYRHAALVRLTHWLGVACIALLFVSGLQIFNAHPKLYFGRASDFASPIAEIGARRKNGHPTGFVAIGDHQFDTTGVLGASGPSDRQQRAFPAWLTLPSDQDLATGRRWHFFFAWLLVADGLIYLIYSVGSRHLWFDLLPSGRQLRHIGQSIREHIVLRFPRGDAARHYNVLQRLSYLAVLLVLIPLLILTGLTMSPGLDAEFPFLAGLLGGRQTARTVHFFCAFTLVAFAAVHVAMVLVSGVWNNMRSMITGWYAVETEASSRGRQD